MEDFYKWGSCTSDLLGVRVPLLCINADDDPIVNEIPDDEVRRNDGGWAALVVTKGGGHLGWFEKDGKRRWIMKPTVQWLAAINEEVVWGCVPGALEAPLEKVVTRTSASSDTGSEVETVDSASTQLIDHVVSGTSTTRTSGEEGERKFVMASPDNHLVGYRVLATGLDPGDNTTIPGGYAGL